MLRDLLPHNAVCAEVGVCEGVFAKHIWEITAPSVLHLIDVWGEIDLGPIWVASDKVNVERLCKVSEMFLPAIKAGRAFLHQGLSVQLLQSFPNGYFDWVYIDADHRYESVAADLMAASDVVHAEGFIAGHDFWENDGVGVVRAVQEFCEETEWRLIATSNAGRREGSDPDGRLAPSFVLRRL